MQPQVNVCPRFWRDIKDLYKHTKFRYLQTTLNLEQFESSDDEIKLNSIPYVHAISNTIINKLPDNLDDISDQYDRQHLLHHGWVIRKMRYALNNKGKSDGVRIIFCVNSIHIIYVYINQKNLCADERKMEAEFMSRINSYLNI